MATGPTDRPTFVYIIACGDHVKIGISHDPNSRLKDMLPAMPEPPHLFYTREFPNAETAFRIEKQMHAAFRTRRSRGEWFRVPATEARRRLRSMREYDPAGASARVAALFDKMADDLIGY